jgi:lipoprotein signal peptidase
LPEFQPVPVIDGFWNWYRTYNTGAAFSFLSDAGGWQIWLFSALAFAISVTLAVVLARTARGDWKTALPFALVIGGAIGNVVDRIQHGHVIDSSSGTGRTISGRHSTSPIRRSSPVRSDIALLACCRPNPRNGSMNTAIDAG